MFVKNTLAHIARLSVLGPLVFASAPASAADLPCVQRAINWNNQKPPPPDKMVNRVSFSVVSLHSTGVASFASSGLSNKKCSGRWGIGLFDCLTSANFDALLSNRFINGNPRQPFDAAYPLRLTVTTIPPDSVGQVRLQQLNATYDFYPSCVGDLLTGNDQWGNHWTMSFNLYRDLIGPH
jgi:hypothetical protein